MKCIIFGSRPPKHDKRITVHNYNLLIAVWKNKVWWALLKAVDESEFHSRIDTVICGKQTV